MTEKYQVVVIGAGPGGYIAAIRAAQLGFKTACVEMRKTLGGTCLNVGCIPSKTLLQTTHEYSQLKEKGNESGIIYQDLKIDFPQLMKRKENVVEGLVNGVAGLFKKNKVDWIAGQAKFLDAHRLEIHSETSTKEITSDYFIIATGSESITLPFLPIDEKVIITSTGALNLEKVPKKMVVIGAGVIGVELASVYARLGTEVTVIEMLDVICPMLDPDLSKHFLQILKKQGLQFYLSSKVTQCQKNDEGVAITAIVEGKEKTFSADVVLVSIGRKPHTSGLNLQEIGVAVDQKGFVVIDNQFRSKVSHILAIGDVVDGPMLAHKASDEGIAAVEILAGLQSRVNYLEIPNVIYTHPEVASVGLGEKEAKDLGLEIKTGKAFFKGNARARCINDTEGFVKVVAEAQSNTVIGLHIIGPNASEMIGEGVLALRKRAKLEDIAYASHAHPTLSESIKEAAQDALKFAMH